MVLVAPDRPRIIARYALLKPASGGASGTSDVAATVALVLTPRL